MAFGGEDLTVHRGSGNFLVDRGVEDPEEFRVRAHLCLEIATIMERRDIAQEQAATLAGLGQSDIYLIVNSRFQDLSVWRLLKVLAALGADVLITVDPNSDNEPGMIVSQTLETADETA